jgi:hypothetical protein
MQVQILAKGFPRMKYVTVQLSPGWGWTELESQRNWCILILPYARHMLANM